MNPLMNPQSLTEEKRGYLLGLYLADGWLEGRKGLTQRVNYAIQSNETEIVEKVVAILAHADLKPRTYRYGGFIQVSACSTNLNEFFPDKKALLKNNSERSRFLDENNLRDQIGSTAFCAGLLDGDGSCRLYFGESRSKRSDVLEKIRVRWSFYQVKYPFLIDFFCEFVESLSKDSSSLIRSKGQVRGMNIKKKGREALLQAGIAQWSWKARQCMELLSSLLERREKERAKRIEDIGMRLPDVAELLGISASALRCSCWRGSSKAILLSVGRRGLGSLVIPRDEVERLKMKYLHGA